MIDNDPHPARWWRERALRQRVAQLSAGLFAAVSLMVLMAAGGAEEQPPTSGSDETTQAGAAADDEGRPAGEAPVRGPDSAGASGPDVEQPAERAVSPRTLAVSASGGLAAGTSIALAAEPDIEVVTVVRGATLDLVETTDDTGAVVDDLPEGWRFPVEVLSVDPETYHEVLGIDEVLGLAPDQGLLSESSAAVRRVGNGGVLRFRDGTRVTVAGVLPDELVGAAELLVTTESPLPIPTARYLLARAVQPLDDEGRARLLELAGDRSVVASGGQVPVLRHAASVTPPARLKVHFGEFAMTDGPGRWIRQGATWLRDAYAQESVPILGETECHRDMFPPLRAAMQQLVDRDLAHLIDADDSGGCWAPRTQGSSALSSHAWGITVDLNVAGNHYGAEPTMPEEVIEAMVSNGFTWGGDWPVPDGMHFELVVDRERPATGR